ncbi:MAG TPA: SRPBCC family protein [Solirubrobacteraceae bacterium]|nr:SRPBCC family protein [Solirubrobacteraceae bacterium]
MDSVTVSVNISRPRLEVFEYLADIANHPEFTDHYLVDWHMTRQETYGRGAGARFKLKQRRNRFPWADVTFAEVEAPHRIVEVGRRGKFNRIRTVGIYELTEAPGGTTRVTFTLQTQPKLISDHILEVGARGWHRRHGSRSMRRLRAILETGRRRGQRATIAGG